MKGSNPFPKGSIFFDLEAGGLSGHQSSILSISSGTNQENISTRYANPALGTKVFKWAEDNVWKPIQSRLQREGRKAITEGAALESFLAELKAAPAATTLAGWNIGYQRVQQTFGESRARGFDIPMLLTRAEAYGLGDEFQEVLGKFNIRDIGQEYAWKAANELYEHPNLIEKDLFNQIASYVETGRGYQAQNKATNEQTARWLATQDFKIAGWKQELIHNLKYPNVTLQAHMSQEDTAAAMRLAEGIGESIFGGDQAKIATWNRKTLTQKYINGIKAGKTTGQIAEILQKTSSPVAFGGGALPSVREELLEGIAGLGKEYGVSVHDILKGQRLKETSRKILVNGVNNKVIEGSRFFSSTVNIAKQNPLAATIAAGALTVGAIKLYSSFSGEDDRYDVLEDLGQKNKWKHQKPSVSSSPVDRSAAQRAATATTFRNAANPGSQASRKKTGGLVQ